jgi:hypothetical protein
MLTNPKIPRAGQNLERRKLFAEMKRVAADGEWHDPATIAKLIGANADDVEKMFLRIRRDGTKPRIACESKQVGTKFHYRIFNTEKMVSVSELTEKLGPLVKGVVAEGKKNVATVSFGHLQHLGALLQRHLDDWSK